MNLREDSRSPLVFLRTMSELTKQTLTKFIEDKLSETDCFLVYADITKTDVIVAVDSDSRVDIDFVAQLSREIEDHFSPEIDAYNLEVGSVGLTSPMMMPRQFAKNRGNNVEVIASDGKKYHGILLEADDDGFVVSIDVKVKKEGQKRPVTERVDKRFAYADAKKVTYDLKID